MLEKLSSGPEIPPIFRMAIAGDDFEKGPHAGAISSLNVFAAVVQGLNGVP